MITSLTDLLSRFGRTRPMPRYIATALRSG